MTMKYELAGPTTQPPAPWTYWVVEGQLLAGAYPAAPRLDDSRTKLSMLLEAGITKFVNLMEANETNHDGDPFTPYNELTDELADELASPATVSCVRHAVRDRSIPSRETMQAILHEIDAALANGKPVYVHCWGGVGRTGTAVGCWLLRHGLADKDNVIETIRQLRKQDQERSDRESPENDEQREFVLGWE